MGPEPAAVIEVEPAAAMQLSEHNGGIRTRHLEGDIAKSRGVGVQLVIIANDFLVGDLSGRELGLVLSGGLGGCGIRRGRDVDVPLRAQALLWPSLRAGVVTRWSSHKDQE